MRVPRSRGALSGTLLVLLGLWGALIPFVGPYFDYAYTPDTTWDVTTGRLLFEVLPGAGAVLGGLLVLASANRVTATLGGCLAALSGAWFVVGVPLAATWDGPAAGEPIGGTTREVLEYLGFFGGLGVVMVFLAAFALGRFAVVGVREAERVARPAEEPMTTAEEEPETTESPAAPEQEPTAPEQEPAGGRRRLHWRRSKHLGAQ